MEGLTRRAGARPYPFADSDLKDGSEPFYAVVCWNSEHSRQKIFRNLANKAHAESLADELRRYGIDAMVHAVGEP